MEGWLEYLCIILSIGSSETTDSCRYSLGISTSRDLTELQQVTVLLVKLVNYTTISCFIGQIG